MPYDLTNNSFVFLYENSLYLNNQPLYALPEKDPARPKPFTWTVFEKIVIYIYDNVLYMCIPGREAPLKLEFGLYTPQAATYIDLVVTSSMIYLLSLTPQGSQKCHQAHVAMIIPEFESNRAPQITQIASYVYEVRQRTIQGKIEFEREVFDRLKGQSGVFLFNVKRQPLLFSSEMKVVEQKAYLKATESEKQENQAAKSEEKAEKPLEPKKEKPKEIKITKGGDLNEKKEQLGELRGQIGNKLKEINTYVKGEQKDNKNVDNDPGRLNRDLKEAFVDVKKEKQKMEKQREKNKDKNKKDRRQD